MTTKPYELAWRFALGGAALGVLFVLKDNLSRWEAAPDFNLADAIARLLGGALGVAALFWMGAYAYGIYRGRFRKKS
jgi:hypothetical protein